MDISVIIVSYKVRDLMERNLRSIFSLTKDIDYEVIVVDNDSQDGTVEMIKEKFPQVKLLDNRKNLGFAKANNLGLKEATGKYIIFMNPDMEIFENSFNKIFDFLESHQEIDVLTTKLLYEDKTIQPNIKNDPNLTSQIIIMLKLASFKPFKNSRKLKEYLNKKFDYNRFQRVNQIMGAMVIGRRQMFLDMGGWNEDYWIWWEDIDLCKAYRKKGKRIYYWPGTAIIHYESKSFAQLMSFKKQRMFNKAMRTYFKKHQPWWQYCAVSFLHPFSLILALVVQIFGIKPRTQSKMW